MLLIFFLPSQGLRAETSVSGKTDAIRVEARDAPVQEVLETLSENFGLQYRSATALTRRLTGTYEGSLHQVVRRVVAGYDFVIKVGPGDMELVVYGTGQPRDAQLVARIGQLTHPPQVTSHKTTRAARRARRGY
jgi:hypothetical protein